MQALILALQNKHAELDRRLKEEQSRPRPDDLAVMRIKIAKLRVKDELERLWRERRARNRDRLAS